MSVMTRLRAAAAVAPHGVLRPGWVDLDGPRIVALGEGEPPPDPAVGQVLDLGDVVLVPGFVDLHCHGGGGASFGADPGAARTAAALHLAHGTTSLMASLVAGPTDRLRLEIAALAPLVEDGLLVEVETLGHGYHGSRGE